MLNTLWNPVYVFLLFHVTCVYGQFHIHITRFTNSNNQNLSNNFQSQDNGTDRAIQYLKKFGYLDDISLGPDSMSLTDISNSIKDFQELMSLNVTGTLDEPTLKLMSTPRCANKDKVYHHHHSSEFLAKYLLPSRNKRYAVSGSRWEKSHLTYKITQYSRQKQISQATIDQVIFQAFEVWQKEVNINFVRSAEPTVDIEVRFTTGYHGDSWPFEHTSNIYAHAFYPSGPGLAGDIHFNDFVDWTVKNKLLYTAVHEIGHSLGLRHSSEPNSIMYSHLIKDLNQDLLLDTDDITGMRLIYGPRNQGPVFTETTTRSTTEIPSDKNSTDFNPLCFDGRFDAATTLPNNNLLVFKGENMFTYRLKPESNILKLVKGPESIRKVFNNRIPSNLDAVFTRNNKVYFLKGNLFWRTTTSLTVDGVYPKKINEIFIGVPDNIDAAFVWSDNNLYFFKSSKFYFFNERAKDRRGKVLSIERHWKGVPEDIDSVFQGPNGLTYFFKAGNYWRYDDQRDEVSISNPNYPRSATDWFFSCHSSFQQKFDTV